MKKFIVIFVLVLIFHIVYNNRDYIITYIMKNYFDKKEITFGDRNKYFKDIDYGFVQNTDNLEPKNRQDILNIIYTFLNTGNDEITFYCPFEYEDCMKDVNEIAENNIYLSFINNIVHPFNSYSNIYFSLSDYHRVHISISKIYPDKYISMVNDMVDSIYSSIINDNMSLYDKIVAFHDYIIDNSFYDDNVNFYGELPDENNSNNAYGLLYNKKAICSGYTDTMAIFLSRLGLNNYKISSDDHIWNLVYYDGSWKHIDSTWDDPVTEDGTSVLLHDFFLIDSNKLFELENKLGLDKHRYNASIYLEAN